MPRSRRRKSVPHPQTIRERTPAKKRGAIQRAYYDPAKAPRPRNHAKEPNQGRKEFKRFASN